MKCFAPVATETNFLSSSLVSTATAGEVEDWGAEWYVKQNITIAALKSLEGKFTNPAQISELLAEVGYVTYLPYTTSATEVGTSFSPSIYTDLSGEYKPSAMVKPSEFGQKEKDRRRNFSLELVLGMGTNFIALLGNLFPIEEQALINRFAQQRSTPFVQSGKVVEKNMLFLDAGTHFSSNVPILVKQKVDKLIIPIWSPDAENKYSSIFNATNGKPLDDWANFGYQGFYHCFATFFGLYLPYTSFTGWNSFINHIFDDGEIHCEKVRKDFDELYLADKPLVTTLKNVKVIDNPYYGIVGGDTIDITVMYVTMPKSFAESVPVLNKTLDSTGSFSNSEFEDFPNLASFDAVPVDSSFKLGKLIKKAWNGGLVTNRQANMMAYLGSWLIKETWEGVSVNGKEYFGGFKEIMES